MLWGSCDLDSERGDTGNGQISILYKIEYFSLIVPSSPKI